MWRPVVLVLGLLLAAPLHAQEPAMAPASVAVAEDLATALEAAPFGERAAIWAATRPGLAAAAAADPTLAGLLVLLDAQQGAVAALNGASLGLEALATGTGPDAWRSAVQHLLAGLAAHAAAVPPSTERLYDLSLVLERLGPVEADTPAIAALLERARAIGAAGLSAGALADREDTDFRNGVAAVIGLLPPPSPQLALIEVREWNRAAWGASVAALGLAADARATGTVDTAALGAIMAQFADLAEDGPLGGPENVALLRRWSHASPVLARLVAAGWPPVGPEVDDPDLCRRIDCDCDHASASRSDCRATEEALGEACRASGAIASTCHPTASGPGAYPPG